MGRKSAYTEVIQPKLAEIQSLAADLNDKEIAEALGISEATFYKYKAEKKEFSESIKKGRQKLVADLKKSLYQKAKGYTYTEVKETIREENGHKVRTVEKFTKVAHADTGAIHLLLKNYDKTWRNDDHSTIELKQKHLDIEKQKADQSKWD